VDRDDEPDEELEATPPARQRPGRAILTLAFTPLVLITVGNYVATAFLPSLIANHPAWLIGLDPRTRNLVLVATKLSLQTYFLLAVVRRMIPHPLWFMVGRWYGDAGVRWIEKRSPDIGALVATLERWFPRFGWLICLLYPHPLVCVLAGASSMSFLAFMLYTLVGVIFFVWTSRVFGDILHGPVSAITNFASDYKWPLTALSIILVLGYFFMGDRSNKLESVSRMEDELEEEANRNDDQPER
jgi:membrane protein DedA with SNARE-associated domain